MSRASMKAHMERVIPLSKEVVKIQREHKHIRVSNHACARYKKHFNRADVSTEYIKQHITHMLLNSNVASDAQKRTIMNTCSPAIRNQYMHNADYDQYSFGEVIICVAIDRMIENGEEVTHRTVVTLYLEQVHSV